MNTDHPTCIAALEPLVEQLIYERVMMTDDPSALVRASIGRLKQMATDWAAVPQEAVDPIAAVLERLGEGGNPPRLRWGGE